MNTSREYPRIVVAPPGPRAQQIIERDLAHSSTSYIKEYPLAMSHGRGAMIEDVDGNRFIDFMAGIAVASTGYGHPKVVAAVKGAAEQFFSMCGTDFYYQPMSDLVERLARIAPGPSKKRVFLSNSGTEAIEGAIKLVRDSTRRTDLIAFHGSFHGRTYGAMSLGASKVKQRAHFGPFLPGVHHVPYPDPYRLETGGKDAGEFVLEHIEKHLFKRIVAPDDVAAIFIEPLLGEGGYIVPPPGFLKGLRALCDRHGILLVFDEVQTGVGRTGHMWAADIFDVEPDVVCSAKGLGSGVPIGAIIAKESVMKWARGSHGSTFGGSLLGCAAALATLDLVEGGLMENARVMGARLKAGFQSMAERFPCIGDVRGEGLFIGVDFVTDRASKTPDPELIARLEREAFARGLLLLGCGESVIRVAPPLVLDAYDVDTGLAIFEEALAAATAA